MFRQTLHTLRSAPTLWLPIAVIFLCEWWVIGSFDPHQAGLVEGVVFVGMITILAESVLLVMLDHARRGEQVGVLDATVPTVFQTLPIFGAKMVPLLLVLLFGLIGLLVIGASIPSLVAVQSPFLLVMAGIGLLGMLMAQLYTFFVIVAIVVGNVGFGHALQLPLEQMRARWRWLLRKSLPFLLGDGVVIVLLILGGGISAESAFQFTITEEMAELAKRTGVGRTEPGIIPTLSRILNSFFVMATKARGVDLVSFVQLLIPNGWMGGLLALYMALTAPFRSNVFLMFFAQDDP